MTIINKNGPTFAHELRISQIWLKKTKKQTKNHTNKTNKKTKQRKKNNRGFSNDAPGLSPRWWQQAEMMIIKRFTQIDTESLQNTKTSRTAVRIFYNIANWVFYQCWFICWEIKNDPIFIVWLKLYGPWKWGWWD